MIEAQIVWLAKRTRCGGIVASCDLLGLTLEASSLGDLYSLIEEGQDVLLADLFEDGDLQRFFQERGVPVPQVTRNGSRVTFSAPFNVQSVVDLPFD